MAFLLLILRFSFLFLLSLVHFQRIAAVHPPLFNRITPTNERTINLTMTGKFVKEKERNRASAENSTDWTPSSVEVKMRRLKELRNEMRALTAIIKEERRRSKTKDLRHRHRSVADKRRSEISRHFRKWRKKVLSKIHLVMHRLDNLEGEMHRTKDNLQKVMHDNGKEKGAKWDGGTKKRRPSNSHSAETLSASAVGRVQMHRRGELGSVCQNHGECKPGHCCLRDAPMSTVPMTIGQGIGHCIRYTLEEGAVCKHSCACAGRQLLCFREHHQKSNSNYSSPVAVCKRTSSSDLLNGVYENALDSVFEQPKRSLNANIF